LENSNSDGNVAVNLEQMKPAVHFGELFNVVQEEQVRIGHGSGKKTYEVVKMKYSNVSQDICRLFRDLCPSNVARRNLYTSILVFMLVCMQSINGYTLILNYQDHNTKFLYLRTLKKKTARGVAFELLTSFLIQAAPLVLQSDNGREFVAEVIK
jgi:hypothetical protein